MIFGLPLHMLEINRPCFFGVGLALVPEACAVTDVVILQTDQSLARFSEFLDSSKNKFLLIYNPNVN